jgi:hypothetical protein
MPTPESGDKAIRKPPQQTAEFEERGGKSPCNPPKFHFVSYLLIRRLKPPFAGQCVRNPLDVWSNVSTVQKKRPQKPDWLMGIKPLYACEVEFDYLSSLDIWYLVELEIKRGIIYLPPV